MLKNFKTFQIAAEFYRLASTQPAPAHLKDQLERASSSIALNAAEGSGKASRKERAKFFEIAYASCKECQAILILLTSCNPRLPALADELGALLFTLVKNNRAAS